MGTLKDGTFGGFSGKVGNVVGASWNNINYIRSLPSKVNDPKTKKQLKQRSKFTVTMDFLKTITPFIRVGFQSQSQGRMTAFNAAMSYNMQFAVTHKDQEMVLDYPRILVSRGLLGISPVIGVEVSDGKLRVTWDSDTRPDVRFDDFCMLLSHNNVKCESVYDINAGKRSSGEAFLLLPAAWGGDSVEVYLSFKTSNGNVVSDSIYAGSYTVV